MHSVKEPLSLADEGNYALTAVKDIDVTEIFLGLDEKQKHCQNEETAEDCWMKIYFKEGFEKCKCTPYGLRTYSKVEVLIHDRSAYFYQNKLSPRDPCVLHRDCYATRVSMLMPRSVLLHVKVSMLMSTRKPILMTTRKK